VPLVKNRKTNQWNRIATPKETYKNTVNLSSSKYEKKGNTMVQKSSFQQMVLEHLDIHLKKK
jgi:hypothetical protein